MSFFGPQNPGIGGIDELSAAGETVVSSLTGFTAGSIPFTSSTANEFAEDNANFFWDNANNILRLGGGLVVGHTAQLDYFDPVDGNTTVETQFLGTAAADGSIAIARFSDDATGPVLHFLHGRGTTIQNNATIVQDNDDLGNIVWNASDGSATPHHAVRILGEVDDGTPGGNAVGGALVFFTSTTGGTETEALRINNIQDISLTQATANIQVAGADPEKSIWIPSWAMWESTTAGAATVAQIESTTHDVNNKVFDFDAGTQEHVEFSVTMPGNWNAGTMTAVFYWTMNTSDTGDVIWGIQARTIANDAAIDAADFGTAVTVTDTRLADGDMHQTAESGAMTVTSATANGFTQFRIFRDAGAGGDTLDIADARLLGVMLYYTIGQYNDGV